MNNPFPVHPRSAEREALLAIATMDDTRPGEKPAHEVMREIAVRTLLYVARPRAAQGETAAPECTVFDEFGPAAP